MECADHGVRRSHEDPNCWRRFSNVGHFESYVAVGPPLPLDSPLSDTANATGWRYTPFLSSTMGALRSQDLLALPNRTLLPNEDVNGELRLFPFVSFRVEEVTLTRFFFFSNSHPSRTRLLIRLGYLLLDGLSPQTRARIRLLCNVGELPAFRRADPSSWGRLG